MSVHQVKSIFKNLQNSIQAPFLKWVLSSKQIESSSSVDSIPTNKSAIETSCANDQTNIFDLPLDLIFEILLRLPKKEIYSSSLTCKLLLSLTTSPSFIVSYHSLHRHTTRSFFFHQKFGEHPKLISTSLRGTSSVIDHLEKSKHFSSGLSVLASSTGLLLIGDPTDLINHIQLIVFNPATKESLLIPLLPERYWHKWGIAFVGHMNPRSFEITLVGSRNAVYTFSSKNKQWTSIVASADDDLPNSELYCAMFRTNNANYGNPFLCQSAVHANGILCWEYEKSHLRVYSIEESRFYTIKLPLDETTSSYCLSETMDLLKYISITDCMLRVWVLKKACLSWQLEREMILEPTPPLIPIGFAESEYEVVLLCKLSTIIVFVFVYNILDGKLKRRGPNLRKQWPMGQVFPYRLNINFPSVPS